MADAHPLYPQLPARERSAVDAALDLLYVVAYGTSHEVEADGLLRSARAELEHLIPAGPMAERLPPDAESKESRRRVRSAIRRGLDASGVEDDYSVGGLVDDIMECLLSDGLIVRDQARALQDASRVDWGEYKPSGYYDRAHTERGREA